MSEFSGSYLSEIDEFYTAYRELRDRALLSDRDGLPAESFENFSEMPLTFEEMAAGMRQDLEKVYTLTGSLNRFSADYPLVCRQLERMIRRIGSCCVTKTVLEQKGFVGHKAYGRTYEYFPLVSKEAYTQRYMTTVLDNFFDGSLSRLVSFFSEQESIPAGEVNEILNMLKK